mgnify:CR=1 FL=1
MCGNEKNEGEGVTFKCNCIFEAREVRDIIIVARDIHAAQAEFANRYPTAVLVDCVADRYYERRGK